MDSRKLSVAVLGAILAVSASATAALGQDAPADQSVAMGDGNGLRPLPSETAVDPGPCAGGCDAGFGQPCCPQWTASAECILLDRVGSVNQPLVTNYPPHMPLVPGTGVERLNAADLNPGFAGGPKLDLIRHGDCGYDLELLYYQIDGWSSVGNIAPNYLGPLGPPPNWLVMTAPGGFLQLTDYPDQHMVWAYTTRLYNAEVNVRRELSPRVTLLAGFRWGELWENLQGTMPTERAVPFWNNKTTNNLYGFQIGADGKLLEHGRFSINAVVKAGIFDNDAEESTEVSIYRVVYTESAATDQAAFLGEIDLQCKYQITPRLAFKIGYEAMWLQGVALAPAQIQETQSHITAPVGVQALGIASSSGVFYHGATVGLEYAF